MKKIIIGDNYNIANNVFMVDHAVVNGSPFGTEYVVQPVYIGKRVWIEANVTLLRE